MPIASQPAAAQEVAAEIDSHRTPAEVLADLRKEHPPAERLLQSFRDTLGGLRQFIEQRKSSPAFNCPPIVEETPPFQRALTTAAMDTPGAYETKATEAMFDVTLPEPDWKPEKSSSGCNHSPRQLSSAPPSTRSIPVITPVPLAPGRPSKTRKLLYNNSNARLGALHRQMMLDEGTAAMIPNCAWDSC